MNKSNSPCDSFPARVDASGTRKCVCVCVCVGSGFIQGDILSGIVDNTHRGAMNCVHTVAIFLAQEAYLQDAFIC